MPGPSRIDECYVRYLGGPKRSWDECRQYGFISGDGELTRSNMRLLASGDRVWVYMPKYEVGNGNQGYVGVGIVNALAVPLVEFEVKDEAGNVKRLVDLPTVIAARAIDALTPRKAEHAVGITWEKTVDATEAVFEKGFFTNQNVVSRPHAARWISTLETLHKAFGID